MVILIKNIDEAEVLSAFGYWINPGNEVLDEKKVIMRMAKTMEKSDGAIDWDYGLLKRLKIYAEKDKENTFKIIKHFLIDSNNEVNGERTMPIMHGNEIKSALKHIYDNGSDEIQKEITELIDILIEKGSSTFWGLKEIIS